jgi:hypothetical protein
MGKIEFEKHYKDFTFSNGGGVGGRIKVGTFDETQLKNKEDKKAIEKAQKETGLKYIDSKIIKKGGKMFMEVYLIPTDEYLKSSKFAHGGGVDSWSVDNWTIKDYDQILSIVQKLKDEGYSNKDNVELTETFNGKRIELDFYYSTEGDWELYIDVPLSIIQILSKYLAFDKVSGDYTNFNVDFDFYKIRANNSKELVCSISGDWDKSEMPSVIEIKTEQGYIESSYFNSYPRGSFGDFDETQFEKNLKNALNEIKQKNLYSAVVSLEGYEQYSEKVDGLENAKQAIQYIKENTRFQVVKGDVASGDLIKQDEVIENYANGGGVSSFPFIKFEDAQEAIKKVNKGELPKYFSYVEKEKNLYYLPNITRDWVKLESFETKQEAVNWIKNNLKSEGFANGGGVEDYNYYGSMTDESVVMQNCSNGEIHCDILEEIIGSKPEYPYQQVGSIRLQKCYLRPYYKIS